MSEPRRLENTVFARSRPATLLLGLVAVAIATGPALAAATDCPADAGWIEQRAEPIDTTGDDDCSMEQYAWRWFTYLMAGESPQLFQWMRSADAFGTAQPPPWNDLHKYPSTGTLEKEGQAASHLPLYSVGGDLVTYGIRVNRPAYDYVRDHPARLYTQAGYVETIDGYLPDLSNYLNLYFPVGSVETKAAWLDLGKEPGCEAGRMCLCDEQRFVCALDAEGNEIALVGLHVVTKPEAHQARVWTTFEHRDNAPDCQDVKTAGAPATARDWTFFTKGRSCTPASPGAYLCPQPNGFCNCWRAAESPQPTLVCREDPITNPAVVAINEAVAAEAAFGVLRNYQLVGAFWADDTGGPPFVAVTCRGEDGKPVPGTDGEDQWIFYPYSPGSDCAVPSPTQLFGGSTVGKAPTLANTTMETYVQDLSCFVCHKNQPRERTQPGQYVNIADFSFFLTRIVNPGNASAGSAADTSDSSTAAEP